MYIQKKRFLQKNKNQFKKRLGRDLHNNMVLKNKAVIIEWQKFKMF